MEFRGLLWDVQFILRYRWLLWGVEDIMGCAASDGI